jgi:hypothetical protein
MALRLCSHTSSAGLAIALDKFLEFKPDIVSMDELYGLVLAQMS